jgi:hypothetical protein
MNKDPRERYENSIGLYTHFVTQADVHGTVFGNKESNTDPQYLSGGNTELFLEFLEHLHQRTVESKDANALISPATFDPNHPKAEGKTKRGLHNIVAMRHLWMDCEDGDLPPEKIAELFPLTRIAVFNTYSHTSENPRFRVVIPFDKPISAEDYIALYDNIVAKIVDAGYGVGKSRGGNRSGLDVSKKSPTSLFYLACQAANPSDSFFQDYDDGKRKILEPMTWIDNTVIHFREANAQKHVQWTAPREIDQAAVEKATMIWRESPKYPREGDTRFFNYAISLRSAGMSLNDIERKLQDEAGFGRSPGERRAQIPSIMKTLRQSLKKSA